MTGTSGASGTSSARPRIATWSTGRLALAVAIAALALAAIAAFLLRAPSSPLIIVAGDELDDIELDVDPETDPTEGAELEDDLEDDPEVGPTPEQSPGTSAQPREDEDGPGTSRLQTAESEDDGEGRGRAARLAGEHPGRGEGHGLGRAAGQGPGPPPWARGATISAYARETSWSHFPDGGCERGQAIAAVARGEYAPGDLAAGLPAHLAERCAAED